MKSRGALAAALLGISAIICVAIFVSGMKQFRKSDIKTGITATGSASCDFEADLVVWRGSFKSSQVRLAHDRR